MDSEADPAAFFAPVEQRLMAFAEHFNLRVFKYAYGQPIWEFFGKHPLGGVIIVELERNTHQPQRSMVFVNSMWTRDDFERRQRWHWRSEADIAELEADAVAALLEEALRAAASATIDQLKFSIEHPSDWTPEKIKQLQKHQEAMPEPILRFSSSSTGSKAN